MSKKKNSTKAKDITPPNITPEILNLKEALCAVGIDATIDSYAATCNDGRRHFCTFVSTDFFAYEDTLEFVFHPVTGQLVNDCLACPVVKS